MGAVTPIAPTFHQRYEFKTLFKSVGHPRWGLSKVPRVPYGGKGTLHGAPSGK